MFAKFLDPKNDVAFKRIFGTEKNKDILIHFLNDMITFKEGGKVQEVTFLKTVQDPETASKKTSVVDILCKDEKGNLYVVEMQVAKAKGFEKRAQYYAPKVYIAQADESSKFHDLKEVIFLAIADFVMFPNKEDYKSDHVILDKKSYENDLKDFSFTFVELPKFNKDIDHLSTMAEKWTYFFKHATETSSEELEKLIDHDVIIKKAYKALDRHYWNDEEYRTYEQSEKYEKGYHASMAQKFDEGEKVGVEKGKLEGEKIGIEKGKVEGEKIGIEKGAKEALLKVAKHMLKQGTEIPQITAVTGLSKQEIESLKKDKVRT